MRLAWFTCRIADPWARSFPLSIEIRRKCLKGVIQCFKYIAGQLCICEFEKVKVDLELLYAIPSHTARSSSRYRSQRIAAERTGYQGGIEQMPTRTHILESTMPFLSQKMSITPNWMLPPRARCCWNGNRMETVLIETAWWTKCIRFTMHSGKCCPKWAPNLFIHKILLVWRLM